MNINLEKVSKRYRSEWIFRKLSFTFQSGNSYAILGPNGSGKSTLLKVLSGHLSPSKGKISFHTDSKTLKADDVYQYVSFAAPYIEVIEEMTLRELIEFQRNFKPFLNDLPTNKIIDILGLQKSSDEFIRNYSSGMRQRVKLALSILADTPILLLDEPTTNLDDQGMTWYKKLVQEYQTNRLVIIASNVPVDYDFCNEKLLITDYKKAISKAKI